MHSLKTIFYRKQAVCRLLLALMLQLLVSQSPFAAQDAAQMLYTEYQGSIYQIRVIELATGNKASIGSGFLVSAQGHIATNYHVISQIIQDPKRYRLEYVAKNGDTGDLEVIDIDVIHDLAITHGKIAQTQFMTLNSRSLSKGTRIFSLGNPHDFGMSVIEGTYNGLLEKSLYDKIFFSGSLNPGMSGGPTLNRAGQVIGVNVSTAGNQLSFLVPAKFLNNLILKLAKPGDKTMDFTPYIEQQLTDNQATVISHIVAAEWKKTVLGNAQLPDVISPSVTCWGDSDDDDDALIEHAFSRCQSEDHIYLGAGFTTGGIEYSYDLLTNKELSSLHFYNLYNKYFGQSLRVNSVSEEDVSNYQCNTQFVKTAGSHWKIAFCARTYTKFSSLYDVAVSMALVSESDKGLVIKLAIAGVSKELAMAFTKRFIEEVHWQS